MRRILAFLGIVGAFAFGASAAEKPNASKTTVATKTNQNGFQIVIVPRDRSGNRIGPGHASSFRITVSSGSASTPVDPNSDGTYTSAITGVSGDSPVISMTYEGVPLYTDRLPARKKHR